MAFPGPGALAGALVARLVAERGRWVLWLPVGMGVGIGGYFAVPLEPPRLLGPVLLLVAVLAALALRHRPAALGLTLGLVALAAGLTSAQVRVMMVDAPAIERRLGPVEVTGRVLAIDAVEGGQRILLAPTRIDRLPPERMPARVRVRLQARDTAPEAGATITIRAVLQPPPGPTEPGAFDFRRHAFFEGIGATGYAVGRHRVVADAPSGVWTDVTVAFERLRQTIAARVAEVVPGPAGPVTAALLHGEQSGIDPEVMEWFRASGLAHLLSISGLHIGLVASVVFLTVRAAFAAVPWIALRYPIKKWAAVVAIAAAATYTLLVGAPVPTVRSMLMTGLVLLAILVDRSAISMRTVAFAAIVVLLLAPDSLLGASFQMSFGAVVAMIAAYEAAQPRLSAWNRSAGPLGKAALYLGGIVFSSVVATLATAPFGLHHFQQLALYGVLANVIAIPLTGVVVMPAAILAYLAMPFGLDALPLMVMGLGVEGIVATARFIAELPGAVLRIPATPPDALLLVVVGGLWLCLWRLDWRWLGLLPVAAGIVGALGTERPDVLVAREGRVIAVRAADGELLLSTGRAGRFDVESWRRRDGVEPEGRNPNWPRTGRSRDGRLDCRPDVCLYRAGGVLVALVRDRAAIERACNQAQVVVTALPAPGCWAPVVIDRSAIDRDGPHALFLGQGNWRLATVRDDLGRRPWTRSGG